MRWELTSVSDEKLLADLSTLVSEHRRRDAELIAHIAEVDRRRLHLDLGYSSMFAYCRAKLHLSESTAYRRTTIGRVALKFPCVLDAIADGRVHVSGMSVLVSVLTSENVERVLAAATHKSKREIERLVAAEAPRPDVPTSVRKVPAVTESSRSELSPARVDTADGGSAPATAAASAKPASQAAPALLVPLASDRYSIKVTVSQVTHDKLRRAQALLRHAVPSGDVAEILDRALDALIEKVEKRKNGATDRPRTSEGLAQGSRHIPNEVKRDVVRRDQHRCAYVAPDGKRCGETSWLELDHIIPVACGGQSTVDNVRQCCRMHNQHRARRQFGNRCGEPARTYGEGGVRSASSFGARFTSAQMPVRSPPRPGGSGERSMAGSRERAEAMTMHAARHCRLRAMRGRASRFRRLCARCGTTWQTRLGARARGATFASGCQRGSSGTSRKWAMAAAMGLTGSSCQAKARTLATRRPWRVNSARA